MIKSGGEFGEKSRNIVFLGNVDPQVTGWNCIL
jgi:hypothetical protein